MLIDDKKLDLIRQHRPEVKHQESLLSASVAIVLRDTEQGTEFLMMQRAHHENDPWSGQMSFPGGKLDPEDENHKAAAIREAYEEVGLQLTEDDYIGQIDDVYGLKANGVFAVHVACFVFKPKSAYTLLANYEVADMVWIPFSYLDERQNAIDHYHPHDLSLKMPAVSINPDKTQVLWGLSLRMLLILYQLLECPISVLSADEKKQMERIEKLEFNINKQK